MALIEDEQQQVDVVFHVDVRLALNVPFLRFSDILPLGIVVDSAAHHPSRAALMDQATNFLYLLANRLVVPLVLLFELVVLHYWKSIGFSMSKTLRCIADFLKCMAGLLGLLIPFGDFLSVSKLAFLAWARRLVWLRLQLSAGFDWINGTFGPPVSGHFDVI